MKITDISARSAKNLQIQRPNINISVEFHVSWCPRMIQTMLQIFFHTNIFPSWSKNFQVGQKFSQVGQIFSQGRRISPWEKTFFPKFNLEKKTLVSWSKWRTELTPLWTASSINSPVPKVLVNRGFRSSDLSCQRPLHRAICAFGYPSWGLEWVLSDDVNCRLILSTITNVSSANRLRRTDPWFNACISFSCLKERPKLISIARNDFRRPKTVLCVPRNDHKCWDCDRIAFCWNKRLLISKVSVSVDLCNFEVNCASKTISNHQKDFDSGQTKKLGQAFPF